MLGLLDRATKLTSAQGEKREYLVSNRAKELLNVRSCLDGGHALVVLEVMGPLESEAAAVDFLDLALVCRSPPSGEGGQESGAMQKN